MIIAPEGEDAKEDACHYIYLCKKRPDADKVAAQNWPIVEAQLKKAEEEEKATYDIDDGVEPGDEQHLDDDEDESASAKEEKGDGMPK